MFQYSNDPCRVSYALLEQMDNDPPGTWLASSKKNGWRRFIQKVGGKFIYRAKPSGTGSDKPMMPPALKAEFEALPWPDGITLDCELTGVRQVATYRKHELWVFDVLALEDMPWLSGASFFERIAVLTNVMLYMPQSQNVHLVEHFENPGIVEMFQRELCDEESEGLVVKRADSKIDFNMSRCTEHAHCRKILKGSVKEAR